MSPVREWPTYLLRDIDPKIRSAIEAQAEIDGTSMIEVVREILCSHYELECETVDSVARPPSPKSGVTTMVLRLQPALWEAIKTEAGPTYGATDKLITEILAAYYA